MKDFKTFIFFLQITDSGDLFIKNLTWREMGEYTCRVENDYGSDSASTFLYPLLVIFFNFPKRFLNASFYTFLIFLFQNETNS